MRYHGLCIAFVLLVLSSPCFMTSSYYVNRYQRIFQSAVFLWGIEDDRVVPMQPVLCRYISAENLRRWHRQVLLQDLLDLQ
jgi:hypothetical protein